MKSDRGFFQRNRLQTRHRPKNFGTHKKIAQLISKLLRFFERAIRNNQPLGIFFRALERNRTGRAACSKNHHAKIAQIDRKHFADRARESAAVGIETAQFATFDLDDIGSADAPYVFVGNIKETERRNFMRDSEVNAHEFWFANEIDRFAEFVRRNLKTRILHVDLAMPQRGVLHSG